MAFKTRGGVTYNWTLTNRTHNNYKKPKSIGKGHGLGGRRKNPTIRRHGNDLYSVDIKK